MKKNTTDELQTRMVEIVRESEAFAHRIENEILDYYLLGGFMDYHEARIEQRTNIFTPTIDPKYMAFNNGVHHELTSTYKGLFNSVSAGFGYLYRLSKLDQESELEIRLMQPDILPEQAEYLRRRLFILKRIAPKQELPDEERKDKEPGRGASYTILSLAEIEGLHKAFDEDKKIWKKWDLDDFMSCFNCEGVPDRRSFPEFDGTKDKTTKQGFVNWLCYIETRKGRGRLFDKKFAKDRLGLGDYTSQKSAARASELLLEFRRRIDAVLNQTNK